MDQRFAFHQLIYMAKLDVPSLDIHRAKIDVPSPNNHGPKIDSGIDIKSQRLIFLV